MFSTRIKERKFPWGGTALASTFPAHGAISIVGSLAGGRPAAREALGRAGDILASTHANMLLEGTKKHSKKELQQLLDSWGASLSFSSDTRLRFSARVRVEHADKLLALIAEILREPAFPARELAVMKKREAAILMLSAQNPNEQAGILLSRMLFPAGHPNRRDSTEESAAALPDITPALLRSYHARTLNRQTLVLSLVGDMPTQALLALAQKFSGLPHNGFAPAPVVPAAPGKKQTATAPIPHKASIDYLSGVATGITQEHPDYAPLMLGLQVLGSVSGFSGRLMKTVREEEGLTYDVHASVAGFSRALDGFIILWATFAPELFAKGRAAVRREVDRIVTGGVTEKEARWHREQYEARFRVRLSSSGALARAAHEAVLDGTGVSYLDEFPKRVLKITAKEINRVLKKYLLKERLCEAAAGPVDKSAL